MEEINSNFIHEIIDEDLRNNPNLKIPDIAKYCNISEPGIYSIFRRYLNKTPNEIKNEILCKNAVSLLTTTNKSVQEISDTLNFSSTSYFRKILREHTGKTPLEIRKEADF
jgi:AraC-like DNA-binding protein